MLETQDIFYKAGFFPRQIPAYAAGVILSQMQDFVSISF